MGTFFSNNKKKKKKKKKMGEKASFEKDDEQLVLIWVVRFAVLVLLYLVYSSIRSIFSLLFQGTKSINLKNLIAPLFLSILGGTLFFVVPPLVDQRINGLSEQIVPTPPVSKESLKLHDELFVLDMHADPLMWAHRDLNKRGEWGHVDVPRMQEGNVAMQFFTIVTASPAGLNMNTNKKPSLLQDSITLISFAGRWGMGAVTSLPERVLFQTNRFKQACSESNGQLRLVTNKREMKQFVDDRQFAMEKKSEYRPIAGLLGIEGLHCLAGDLSNIDVFFNNGVRMMAPTHFFDTELGGSAHGITKGGATEFGYKALDIMEKKGIFLDLAHASEPLIMDLCKKAKRPVLNSHAGVKAVCPGNRTLSDEAVLAIAQTGGVLGVAFFRPCTCGDNEVLSIVQTIKHIRDLAGIEHVALGSDFDGAVKTPFDATGFSQITDGLRREGSFSDDDIGLIMGGNMRRVLLQNLPE